MKINNQWVLNVLNHSFTWFTQFSDMSNQAAVIKFGEGFNFNFTQISCRVRIKIQMFDICM